MSVDVTTSIVESGSDEHVGSAWELKERIREREGVLKQRRGFFTDAYRRATVHLLFAGDHDADAADSLIGFAAVRRDGYVLFLAIDGDHRGEGFGGRLIATVAEEHDTVTCHARATNEAAVAFYKHIGFEVERHIEHYYEDGGAAYYLKLGDRAGLADRLSAFVRGR
ncbi:GNAT family N-acetyltransferase [Halococcus hamelinensis]|uniref:GCN5-like N-acetyltransferase n=1 Tax=Halococcus hamelinensis 100A6 TaxID=1132509 RepID=M0M4A0_9EURY|nr:N-acetyltransferase [Halococcus hamelinensis]EMA39205.1 GCN5-like N-acetyltransferase [Halococcus hamelinensis 100A6]